MRIPRGIPSAVPISKTRRRESGPHKQSATQRFNNDTPLSTAINGSPLGDAYHKAFGQREERDAKGNVVTTGTNGYIKGALNAPPGIVVGSAIPLKECNIKVASGSLIPTGIQGGNC